MRIGILELLMVLIVGFLLLGTTAIFLLRRKSARLSNEKREIENK